MHLHFVNRQPPAMMFNPGCGPSCRAAHTQSKRAAKGTVRRGDQSASRHNTRIPNAASAQASWLCSPPLPVHYKARPVCDGDLELQLKIRGYNSQANYFPTHYSSISSSACYFSCHFATFQSFAIKQINHFT